MDFIGVWIGDQPAMESNMSYYQRLLAMDQAEAAEIVEEHLKSHRAEQLYDDVLIPALTYARRDRNLGRVTEDGEQFVFRATREILEDLNSLKPQSSPGRSDASTSTAEKISPVIAAKFRILGCPAQDEADELALLMLQQLLDGAKYELDILTGAMLTAEVVAQNWRDESGDDLYRSRRSRRTDADTLSLQATAGKVSQSQDCRRSMGDRERRR